MELFLIGVLVFISGFALGYHDKMTRCLELETEVIKLELQNQILIRDKRRVDSILTSIKSEEKGVIVLYEPKPDFDYRELFNSELVGVHNDDDWFVTTSYHNTTIHTTMGVEIKWTIH